MREIPKIRIPNGLPFRFPTPLGEMELRAGPTATATTGYQAPEFLAVVAVNSPNPDILTWRLTEDSGPQMSYYSILMGGYELVDLANPECEDFLRTILKALVDAPGIERIVESSVRGN